MKEKESGKMKIPLGIAVFPVFIENPFEMRAMFFQDAPTHSPKLTNQMPPRV
jgi:hypothetical protein